MTDLQLKQNELNYTIIYKKLNIDNYIKRTTSDLKQQIRILYIW